MMQEEGEEEEMDRVERTPRELGGDVVMWPVLPESRYRICLLLFQRHELFSAASHGAIEPTVMVERLFGNAWVPSPEQDLRPWTGTQMYGMSVAKLQ